MNFTKTRESGFLRFCLPETQHLPVGASLLAKNFQTTRFFSQHAPSFTPIASKLAPTGFIGAFEKQYRLSLLQVFAM
ncbi:hypothetical protein [Pseudomonas fluorescens]|uniref:hypothetical protein n=1 Tax=Pseudomonas fluorescens TaxID=294 RepID=UPI00124047C1|nr:hypothetical protein [Pseudomonas fluorescens]